MVRVSTSYRPIAGCASDALTQVTTYTQYVQALHLILLLLTHIFLQIITGLILSAVSNEFHFQSPFLKLAQSLGQLVGCTFWGIASDVWGRRYVLRSRDRLAFSGLSLVQGGVSTSLS